MIQEILTSVQHSGISYVLERLTSIVTQELLDYISTTLASSRSVFEERGKLVADIQRDATYDHIRGELPSKYSLTDMLQSYIESASAYQNAFDQSIEDIQQRRERLAYFGISYEEKSDKIKEDVYKLRMNIEKAEERRKELLQKKEVFCLLAPVKTSSYTGIRVVLPIDAESPLPQKTIMDYFYSLLNVELATTFQQEAFGSLSLEDIVQLSTTTLRGDAFHAIDVKCNLAESDVDQLLAYTSEFILQCFNPAFMKLKGVHLDKDEIADANVIVKPFIFPHHYKNFIQKYCDMEIEFKIKKLRDDFIEFLIDTCENHLRVSGLNEKIIEAPIESDLFSRLLPYKEALERLCEGHSSYLMQRFYTDVLNAEYQPPQSSENQQNHVEWMKKTDALKTFFLGTQEKIAKKIYEEAIQKGALMRKIVNGQEYVSRKDLLDLHRKTVAVGAFFKEVYDEPVLPAFEFADRHNLDRNQFNKLLNDDEVRASLRGIIKDRRAKIYILQDNPDAAAQLISLYRRRF